MANAYKILGQTADASANDVTLYTVPAKLLLTHLG
jgi:hypothetical protein